MEEFPELWNNKIDKLYLDTTYCKPDYDFPSQSSVICATVDMVKSHLETYPKSLICVGSYTIGKERIFTAIAEKIDAQIWAATEKSRVLRALDDPIIKSRLVSTAMLAKLHVLDMAKVRQKSALSDHLNKFKGKFDEILSIVPTGWSHEKGTSSDLSLSSMKIKNYRDNVFVLNVPYSEHSSYSEMKRFVQFLKLDNSEKILATVNVGNPETRNAQKALFKQWIDEMNHRPNQFKKTSTLMTRR
jgi:DNA cross-link repair 1A protein